MGDMNMKKRIFLVIFIICLTFAFSGCGKKEVIEEKNEVTKNDVEITPTTWRDSDFTVSYTVSDYNNLLVLNPAKKIESDTIITQVDNPYTRKCIKSGDKLWDFGGGLINTDTIAAKYYVEEKAEEKYYDWSGNKPIGWKIYNLPIEGISKAMTKEAVKINNSDFDADNAINRLSLRLIIPENTNYPEISSNSSYIGMESVAGYDCEIYQEVIDLNSDKDYYGHYSVTDLSKDDAGEVNWLRERIYYSPELKAVLKITGTSNYGDDFYEYIKFEVKDIKFEADKINVDIDSFATIR